MYGSFEINSKMWYTPLPNPLVHSVYHIFEFISSWTEKNWDQSLNKTKNITTEQKNYLN
jgi:hypothetical protein